MQLQTDIITAIINSGNDSITPAFICDKIQCPENVVFDCLADMEDKGLVQTWEDDGKLKVTLSPLSAERNNVHLVSKSETAYSWALVGDPLPRPRNRFSNTRDFSEMDSFIIGDVDTPDNIVELSEEVGTLSAIPEEKRKTLPKLNWQGVRRLDDSALPYPTVLLGAGSALWDNVKHDVCPGCGGRQLEAYEFCLRCDNWGMDRFLGVKNRAVKVHLYPQHKADKVDILVRLAKQQRKEKRNERLKSHR